MLAATSEVDGDIDLGGGPGEGGGLREGQVAIYAGARVNGAIRGAGPTSALRLLAGDGAGTTRLGEICDFGQAHVDGGRWVWAGEAHVGTVDIDGGHTAVEGTLHAERVNVAGGVLGGSGVIAGDVYNTAGNVSPGNSHGVLTIGKEGRGGDYTQAAGAELVLEIRGAGDPKPGVDYDQLPHTW